MSRGRALSLAAPNGKNGGLKDAAQRNKAIKMAGGSKRGAWRRSLCGGEVREEWQQTLAARRPPCCPAPSCLPAQPLPLSPRPPPSKPADKAQWELGRGAKKGEADRHIPDFKPKHLFSGKRPRGTTDRR
jgi:hypothetical protein